MDIQKSPYHITLNVQIHLAAHQSHIPTTSLGDGGINACPKGGLAGVCVCVCVCVFVCACVVCICMCMCVCVCVCVFGNMSMQGMVGGFSRYNIGRCKARPGGILKICSGVVGWGYVCPMHL